jgi:NTE family protein
MFVHLIEAEDIVRAFSWSSRLNGDWKFLTHLRDLGRERADRWLAANFEQIGVDTTVDLEAKYF